MSTPMVVDQAATKRARQAQEAGIVRVRLAFAAHPYLPPATGGPIQTGTSRFTKKHVTRKQRRTKTRAQRLARRKNRTAL